MRKYRYVILLVIIITLIYLSWTLFNSHYINNTPEKAKLVIVDKLQNYLLQKVI